MIVKFKVPVDPGDDALLMFRAWTAAPRAMVEALVGLPINPSQVVPASDLEDVPLKAFAVDGSVETFNGYQYGTWNGWAAVLMPREDMIRLGEAFGVNVSDCKYMGQGLYDMSGFCLLEVNGCAC